MDLVNQTFCDWKTWLLLGAASFVFAWNAYHRGAWDASWRISGGGVRRHPERSWSYDAFDLEDFATASKSVTVNGRPALVFYVNAILKGSDIFFAIALAVITAFVWYRIAISPMPWRWINWLALPAAAMAILYGVADIAEGLKLATILNHPDRIDRAEATAANMLTRVKILTLTLSLVGAGFLLIFWAVEKILAKVLEKRMRRRPAPAAT